MLARVLQELYDDGFKGPNVAVLSMRRDEICCASRLNVPPWSDRLQPLFDPERPEPVDLRSGKTRYCSVHRFKGAEQRRNSGRRTTALVVVAVVLVVAALGAAVLLLRAGAVGGTGGGDGAGGGSPSPQATASVPPARLGRLADLKVRQGEKATIRCRVLEAPAQSAAFFIVTDAGGGQVKSVRLAGDAVAGERLEAQVRIDLEPGRYTYELQLRPGGAAASSGAAPEASAEASPGTALTTPPASLTPAGTSSGAAGSSPAAAPSPLATATAELRVLKPLPPGYPGAKAVAAATKWLSGRDGDVAFAVVDSNGELAGGYRPHQRFQLASVAKVILLVATLRDDPTPDAATKATLTRMITESDNDAAYTIFGRVDAKGMRAVAKAAGLEDYRQGSDWVDTRDSAADQARLFWQLEELVPAKGRGLLRRLLSSITPLQRWGIPAAAGPEGWKTYFKSGWLGLDNKLMVQAAWLEKGKKRWALAVMSDENPTRSTGWDTQKGVAGVLLGQEPTAAYLARVLE